MKRVLFFLACVGCSSSNISSTDLDEALSQYDGDSSSDTIKPRNGDWSYSSVSTVSDTCSNLIDMLSVGEGFEVDRSGLSFDLVMDGSGASAACTIGGDQFDCEPVGEALNPEDAVTFHTTVDTRGVLYSPDMMEGVHELDVTCDGTGCGLLAIARDVNFPCKFGVFYTASSG